MTNVDEALAIGTRLHRAGQLAEAERAYRQALAADPNHPHALHQLGMLALQARQFEAAVDLIGRAVRADRMQPAFHANLGEAYRQLGNADLAAESYRRAIKLDPRLPQPHALLGTVLHEQKKLDEAADSFRQALRLLPEDQRARLALGRVLEAQKKLDEAEACFRRVLRTETASADPHFHLASVLQSKKRLDESKASYRAALAIDPNHFSAHNNLGTILKDEQRFDEAEQHLQAAIRINPDHPAAHTNLGVLREKQDRLDEAAASLARALELDRSSVLAWHSLGVVLEKQRRFDDAVTAYQEAIRIDPNYAPSHMTLGYHYQRRGLAQPAIDCCRNVIRLDPNCADAYSNLGAIVARDGQHDEAITLLRRAIELRPDLFVAYSNLAISLQSLGLLDEAIENHRRSVERAVALAADGAGQHSNLLYILNYHPAYDAATLFAEHVAWGDRWANPLAATIAPHANDRTPDRRLRVGYVSAHFIDHAINFFMEPILAAHDHSRFEIFGYCDVLHDDETTLRLRTFADHWRQTTDLTDAEVADLVRRDEIDILVDLTGHINGGKRMLTFARKPAPVQVTYIGYQNTTGMRAMDYRLTDDYSDPPGLTDALHTEKLVRLPTTFFCYLPSADAPSVGELPAATAPHVTFGSVNAFNKITPQVLAAWAGIIVRAPGSRLIIRGDMTDSLRRRLLETFASHGVDRERLELVNRLPRPQYLELIKRMDIALDPFPFNGHTTTCDCLWQGVPVVTLSGNTYVTRFGGSGLKTLGLDELIAHSPEEYQNIAVNLASDIPRLTRYRSTLRDRMAHSPLLDFPTFTRNLETEYRRMWHAWCAKTDA